LAALLLLVIALFIGAGIGWSVLGCGPHPGDHGTQQSPGHPEHQVTDASDQAGDETPAGPELTEAALLAQQAFRLKPTREHLRAYMAACVHMWNGMPATSPQDQTIDDVLAFVWDAKPKLNEDPWVDRSVTIGERRFPLEVGRAWPLPRARESDRDGLILMAAQPLSYAISARERDDG
jgi:hypothetical protein